MNYHKSTDLINLLKTVTTHTSHDKLNHNAFIFDNAHLLQTNKLHPKLKFLLDDMLVAFTSNLLIENVQSISKSILRLRFKKFNELVNSVTKSKFNSDLQSMNDILTFKLTVNSHIVTINFIMHEIYHHLIATIIHAINTFCHLFKHDYHNLTINVCLDHNKRDLILPTEYKIKTRNDYRDIFHFLQKKSYAYNASGMTNINEKVIYITRTEEIIKLLFHELSHYAKLDYQLLFMPITDFKLSVETETHTLNSSEAYTEFMAVILNSAYQTIHLFGLKHKTNELFYDTYAKLLSIETEYSCYLASIILKFYDYDKHNVMDFFLGIGEKKYSPIAIWEYVFLRAQLMLNLDAVLKIVHNNWIIDRNNQTLLINLMTVDERMIQKVKKYMEYEPNINISYTMIDFDWNKF